MRPAQSKIDFTLLPLSNPPTWGVSHEQSTAVGTFPRPEQSNIDVSLLPADRNLTQHCAATRPERVFS